MPDITVRDTFATLRRRAEAKALLDAAPTMMPVNDNSALVHELRVHQIELEMQNEELRRAVVELEVSRERYFDLYDLAPLGYLSVSDKGLILESNLSAARMLGEPRSALLRQSLARFFLPEDVGTWFVHRKKLFDSREAQSFDLQLLSKDGKISWARLDTTLAAGTGGERVLRVALSDVNRSKALEVLLHQKAATLEEALSKQEGLAALLPLCAHCHRIRDEQGTWHRIDTFIAERARTRPTLLCDGCERLA